MCFPTKHFTPWWRRSGVLELGLRLGVIKTMIRLYSLTPTKWLIWCGVNVENRITFIRNKCIDKDKEKAKTREIRIQKMNTDHALYTIHYTQRVIDVYRMQRQRLETLITFFPGSKKSIIFNFLSHANLFDTFTVIADVWDKKTAAQVWVQKKYRNIKNILMHDIKNGACPIIFLSETRSF